MQLLETVPSINISLYTIEINLVYNYKDQCFPEHEFIHALFHVQGIVPTKIIYKE